MNRLSEKEGWLIICAPLVSSLVWAAGVVAGNAGWIQGMSTSAPVGATVALTFCTLVVYLITLPLLLRLYRRWRSSDRHVGRRLLISGLVVGTVWGLILKNIGSSYLVFGPLCGAAVGFFLAITLRAR